MNKNVENLVSVIIPVYNVRPEYIQEAIDSVLAQTYKHIEIIVVNDGSTNENTLDYLKTINNPDIKIINQENKGLGGARNTGIEHATGDYLGFLDADDWLENNFYETLIALCFKHNADIACGTLTRVTSTNQIAMDNFHNSILNNFVKKMSFITNGSVCSKIFKRTLFENIRFTEKKYWEDNPVLVELLLKSHNVAFTNTVNYFYRENPESICLNPDPVKQGKRLEDSLFMLKQIYNLKYQNKAEKNSAIKTFIPILVNFVEYNKNSQYKKATDNLLLKEYESYLNTYLRGSKKNKFIENIFSIKNSAGKTHKVITILGLQIKIKRRLKHHE